MKIAVITTATPDLNFREYSIANSKEYCDKHGYDFILFEDKIDGEASVIANKTLTALQNINNYDWLFMKDADSLFYRFDFKIENYVDEKYDYIASWSCIPDVINLGHMLIKCSPKVESELRIIYEEIKEKVTIKGEQPIYNEYWGTGKISPVKKLPKPILNAQLFDKIRCDEWEMSIDELKELDKRDMNFEAHGDITTDTFIVHYPGAFLKSRSYAHERMVHTTNSNWFNFTEEYLPKFIEMYENIKTKNENKINGKRLTTKMPYRLKKVDRTKLRTIKTRRR